VVLTLQQQQQQRLQAGVWMGAQWAQARLRL
jgi:hypothetical protein